MTAIDVRHAIIRAIGGIGGTVLSNNQKKPIPRPCYRVDIVPITTERINGCSRVVQCDVDIWYYPTYPGKQYDEIGSVQIALQDMLYDGIMVGDVQLLPDDAIAADYVDDVLVCQFMVSWLETEKEDGDHMGRLEYKSNAGGGK